MSHTIRPDQTSSGYNLLYPTPADAATIYDTPNTELNADYSRVLLTSALA